MSFSVALYLSPLQLCSLQLICSVCLHSHVVCWWQHEVSLVHHLVAAGCEVMSSVHMIYVLCAI